MQDPAVTTVDLIDLSWKVGPIGSHDAEPDTWIDAQVPGAVQLDWARHEGWGEPLWLEETERFDWMAKSYWVYRSQVDLPTLDPGERLTFCCGGVDYFYRVYVNGQERLRQEGMHRPFELDLTSLAGTGVTTEVRVWPVFGDERPRPPHLSCKPPVAHGWDFHPFLLPLGIWQDTWIERGPTLRLIDAEVRYTLNEPLDRADVQFQAEVTGEGQLLWRLTAPDGSIVIEQEVAASGETTLDAALEQPVLWWPHDQGEPALYHSEVELINEDETVVGRRTATVGFRRIRLVPNDGAATFAMQPGQPTSRTAPPMQLEVNGRRVFGRGSNWVCPDVFPGRITPERYGRQVELARQAGLNLIRVWGGAIIPHDAFYDHCDRYGIMVWQEFPLSCMKHGDHPDYLDTLDHETRTVMRRLRHRASLAIWCSGNELYTPWAGMNEQDLPIRLINRNAYDLDPGRAFLPTTPLAGVGHGPYTFLSGQGDMYALAQDHAMFAYTEFGTPGPPPLETLKRIIPEDERFPVKPDGAWVFRKGQKAMGMSGDSWLLNESLDKLFGKSEDFETMVERGHWAQREGVKARFEVYRRQKPRCSMAINWVFNEPWPNAANNSMLAWPEEPKAGYTGLAAANRPVMASGKVLRFTWSADDMFEVELWLLNDTPDAIEPGKMAVMLQIAGERVQLGDWPFAASPANEHQRGPTLRCRLPQVDNADRMVVRLSVEGRPALDSVYELLYRPKADTDQGH